LEHILWSIEVILRKSSQEVIGQEVSGSGQEVVRIPQDPSESLRIPQDPSEATQFLVRNFSGLLRN
jgi:hypothetical protein